MASLRPEMTVGFGGTVWRWGTVQQEPSMPTGSSGVGLVDRNSLEAIGSS